MLAATPAPLARLSRVVRRLTRAVLPFALVLLPVAAWSAGPENGPAPDSSALAALGMLGLAWAGSRPD